MEQIHSLCHSETIVKVRCHPWCGRHGGHLYKQLNKAYLHFLNDTELEELGIKREVVNELNFPISTYKSYWNGLFKIKKEVVVRTQDESFFRTTPEIAERIMQRWWNQNKWPSHQLTQTFCDFVLSPILD